MAVLKFFGWGLQGPRRTVAPARANPVHRLGAGAGSCPPCSGNCLQGDACPQRSSGALMGATQRLAAKPR